MVTNVKTLDFARGCISMQNHLVTFTQPAVIGVLEVAGSNPIPTISGLSIVNDRRPFVISILRKSGSILGNWIKNRVLS